MTMMWSTKKWTWKMMEGDQGEPVGAAAAGRRVSHVVMKLVRKKKL